MSVITLKSSVTVVGYLCSFYGTGGWFPLNELRKLRATQRKALLVTLAGVLVTGCGILGLRYSGGDGGARDYAEAREWHLKAAEQGYAAAQDNYVEARRWYLKAAEQGYPAAQNNLGALYQNADGVAQAYTMAYVWHNSAAARAHATASKNRDAVVAKLDAAFLAEAQELSKEYFKRYVEPFQETGTEE